MIMLAGAIIVFLIIFSAMGLRIIRPYEKGIVERLGKFQRTAESGLNLVFPIIETIVKVDMREQVIEVPPQ